MADSGYYIGACPDCNGDLDHAHGAVHGAGVTQARTRAASLIVENSEFDHNKTGFITNSQNNDDSPSPQDGACPNNGMSPITHTHSCWVFMHNYVHDNNNPNVPADGSAELGPPGHRLVTRRRAQRHDRRQPLREQRRVGRPDRRLPGHRPAAARARPARAATPRSGFLGCGEGG